MLFLSWYFVSYTPQVSSLVGHVGKHWQKYAVSTQQAVFIFIKGELNPNIKWDLSDSFCTLINKYNPHIF